MLRCVEQRLSEYIDGDLSPAEAREVAHHLWWCDSCREVFLAFRALLAAMRVVQPKRSHLSGPHADTTVLRDAFGRRSTGRMFS
jgi:anti-sigma factor RsiW